MSCSAAERKKEAILIKAVLFDFDGTLVDFVNSDTESLAGILSETNSSAAMKDFVDRVVFHNNEVSRACQFRCSRSTHNASLPAGENFQGFWHCLERRYR